MKEIQTQKTILYMIEDSDIDTLEAGDKCINPFGKESIVNSVIYRGINFEGKKYIGFRCTWSSDNSTITQSYVSGKILRTLDAIRNYNSDELDTFEKLVALKAENAKKIQGFRNEQLDVDAFGNCYSDADNGL